MEYDDNEDALGETEAYEGQAGGEDMVLAKPETESSAPSSGTNTKRKRPLKLTPSQRERKRAIDREAQRSIRIKTKNYIAHLENLVKVMEQSDTTGVDGENNRTRELMNQLKQSQDEVRSLREAMLSVQRTLSTVLGDGTLSIDTARHSSHSASPPSVIEAQSSTSYSAPLQFPAQTSAGPSVPPQPTLRRHPSAASIPAMTSQSEPPSSLPTQSLPERPRSNPQGPRIEGELFFYAEAHLNRVYAAGPAAFGDTALDEDIPVRAVIEGWASVEEHHELDLAWQVIREIDTTIWFNCGVVERMAIIRFMRTKLIHQVNSHAASTMPIMPAFMTQEVVKHAHHADIIDHFIWPGFRHVLVEHPQKYISNYFSDKFRYNLKFLWPYGISNAYTKDPITQTYSSTQEFMSRQWDIRCWTMRRRFFDGAEELISSIPTFDVPLHKPLSLGSTQAMVMPNMGAHRHGMVEEQEVSDDTEGLDAVIPVVGDPNAMTAVSHDGGGDLGSTSSWHTISPDQSIQQFWSISPSNAPMDHAYNHSGMVGHVGANYPM
jgi:hypothetical protein